MPSKNVHTLARVLKSGATAQARREVDTVANEFATIVSTDPFAAIVHSTGMRLEKNDFVLSTVDPETLDVDDVVLVNVIGNRYVMVSEVGDAAPSRYTTVVGPQGPQGIQGIQGIQGPQGIQGVAGTPAPTISLVSALPGSPTDGQVVYFQDAALATDGILWPLRYRSGSANSNKWEPVGQPVGIHKEVGILESTTSGTFVDLTTVGPSVSTPLPGVYRVEFSATQNHNTVNGYAVSGITFDGTVAPNNQQNVHRAAVAGQEQTSGRTVEGSVNAIADIIKMQYYASAGQGSFHRREMTVYPIRVG